MLVCAHSTVQAQNATKLSVNNQELVFENHNWFLLDVNTTDSSFYKIDTTTITIRFVDSISYEDKLNFETTNSLNLIDSFSTYYKYKFINHFARFKNNIESLKNSVKVDMLVISDLGKLNSNDPLFNNQKYLFADFFDIESIRAYWGYGNPNVTIAVIDGFIDWSHPDLGTSNSTYQNIWLNNREDAWANPNDPSTGNGIDDDHNGLIDDWKGYDFYYDDNDVRPNPNFPNNYHGTMVTSIIAAKTNNGTGASGFAGGNNNEGVKVMCLNVAQNNTSSSVIPNIDKTALARAIVYAAHNGAKIICLTAAFSPNTIAPMIDEAINIAIKKYDCIVLCASGNGQGSNNSVFYPAKIKDVLAIGAFTFIGNNITQMVNHYTSGPELDYVAYAMEAENLSYAAKPNNTYGYLSGGGTSVATAQIAGFLALVLSKYECIPPSILLDFLKNSTKYKGSAPLINNRSDLFGYGMPDPIALEGAFNNLFFDANLTTTTTTISDTRYCQTDIDIPAGKTLTITGKLIMANGKKFFVRPQGKLIVDNGGIITSNCEWGGVEVYGDRDPNTSQYSNNDGYVNIKNNSTIENAKCGVKTIGEGIVEANNSNFKNNYISIYINPMMNNINPNSLTINMSVINTNIFIYDKYLKSTDYNEGENRHGYNSFVKIEDSKYLYLTNNYFNDVLKTYEGTAINAFKTELGIRNNKFYNIFNAIESFNIYIYINQALSKNEFMNNQFFDVKKGIFISSIIEPLISGNNISLSRAFSRYTPEGYYEYNWGVFNTNSNANINGNIFYSPDQSGYGTITRNSMMYSITDDYILKNTFNNLAVGSQFEFNYKKLRAVCNSYSNIRDFAWSISPRRDDKNSVFPDAGDIYGNIGGNFFYDPSSINNVERHIKSRRAFKYYYAGTPVQSEPKFITSNITKTLYSNIDGELYCSKKNRGIDSLFCKDHLCSITELVEMFEQEIDTNIQEELFDQIYVKYIENEDIYGFLSFIESHNLLNAKIKEVISTYIDLGDFTTAEGLMYILPLATTQDSDFYNLISVYKNIKVENRSISDLTTNEKNLFIEIKSHDNDVSLIAAQILKFGYGIPYNQNPSQWEEAVGNRTVVATIAPKKITLETKVSVFPNPSTKEGILNVCISNNQKINRIEVYNTLGEMVNSYTIHDQSLISIDFSKFNSGIYTILVFTKDSKYTNKYVKL
jgi:hypothetical protein